MTSQYDFYPIPDLSLLVQKFILIYYFYAFFHILDISLQDNMRVLVILFFAIFIMFGHCNTCINKHCKTEQSQCKEDKSELPCTNVINTCLDLCPSNTNYSCLSFCLSTRKNQPANNFLKCCTSFQCKVEKFTAFFLETHLTSEQNLFL